MAKYKVGFGRPPKATQFKPGRSGNPKGRPQGSRNLATDLAAELGEPITVREDGRHRRVSKQRALIKSLMAKSLQGDVRAAAARSLSTPALSPTPLKTSRSNRMNSRSCVASLPVCSNP
jgi:hypothetical protein